MRNFEFVVLVNFGKNCKFETSLVSLFIEIPSRLLSFVVVEKITSWYSVSV